MGRNMVVYIVVGVVIIVTGEIVTGIGSSLWRRYTQWQYKRKNPPPPFIGRIEGIEKKDFRDN